MKITYRSHLSSDPPPDINKTFSPLKCVKEEPDDYSWVPLFIEYQGDVLVNKKVSDNEEAKEGFIF